MTDNLLEAANRAKAVIQSSESFSTITNLLSYPILSGEDAGQAKPYVTREEGSSLRKPNDSGIPYADTSTSESH